MYKKTTTTTIEEISEDQRAPIKGLFKEDVIRLDVPLMIRLLEYAREDASTDMDLHVLAENLVEMSEYGKVLSMEDYSEIVSPVPAPAPAPTPAA